LILGIFHDILNEQCLGVDSIFGKLAVKRLLLIAGSIAGVSLVLSITITVVLLARDTGMDFSDLRLASEDGASSSEEYFFPEIDRDAINRPQVADEGGLLRPPQRTNFLMVGLDNQLLTDALMVGTFYRDTGDIHLMSIPRDMYTIIPPHRLDQMREDGIRIPSPVKINAFRAFGGRERGIYYLKAQLGEMLGVHFHYYIEVELSAFRRIVDAIDGVQMYIPRRLVYEDPCQNLFIDIPAGMQHLNGEMAEGVVRFRSFPTGDLARNNIQMEFMSQLIRQALTREAIINDPLTLINIVLNDVRTNVGLEVVRYLPFVTNVSADSVTTFVMPGGGAYIGGVSWFMPNAQQLPEVINQVFFTDVLS